MGDTLEIFGTEYTNVAGFKATDDNSNTKTYINVSDTTAVATDVASGKYFYLADGTKTEGTASGGGGWTIDDDAMGNYPSTLTLNTATSIRRYFLAFNTTVETVNAPEVTTMNGNAIWYSNVKYVNFPKLQYITQPEAFAYSTKITEIIFPQLLNINTDNTFRNCSACTRIIMPRFNNSPGGNMAMSCTALTLADMGSTRYISPQCFLGCTNFTTLIIRSTSIPNLQNVNAFNNTPFKSGGTGGTIYIPTSLYDHLGDNSSSDYKHASNWSTVDGYGTITWAKLEGSAYESLNWYE